MSAINTIEKVVSSGLLLPQMISIPPLGASETAIRDEEQLLGREFCPDHASLLRKWNGVSLDIIRIFGCQGCSPTIGQISQRQIRGLRGPGNAIAIGSDISGFVYLQSEGGKVYTFDTDGGEIEDAAANLDDLFDRLVFGHDAEMFAGKDWLAELIAAHIAE